VCADEYKCAPEPFLLPYVCRVCDHDVQDTRSTRTSWIHKLTDAVAIALLFPAIEHAGVDIALFEIFKQHLLDKAEEEGKGPPRLKLFAAGMLSSSIAQVGCSCSAQFNSTGGVFVFKRGGETAIGC